MAMGFSNWSFFTLLLVSYENATNLLLICIFYPTHTRVVSVRFFLWRWKSCKSHVNKFNTIDAKNQTNASFKLNEKKGRKKNHAAKVVYRWNISNRSRSFPHHMAEDNFRYLFYLHGMCSVAHTVESKILASEAMRTCFFLSFST